jgi:hypothetical protein
MTAEKIAVSCPQCGQQLLVPPSALGKNGRCPSCKHIFPLEVAVAASSDSAVRNAAFRDTVASSAATVEDDVHGDLRLQPLPQPQPRLVAMNPLPSVPPGAQVDKGKYHHGFGWEHRGWDKGVMGGVWMMAIAALWFFVGMYFGRVFFYPVILFVVGLVGFFRGLLTGNLAGK